MSKASRSISTGSDVPLHYPGHSRGQTDVNYTHHDPVIHKIHTYRFHSSNCNRWLEIFVPYDSSLVMPGMLELILSNMVKIFRNGV